AEHQPLPRATTDDHTQHPTGRPLARNDNRGTRPATSSPARPRFRPSIRSHHLFTIAPATVAHNLGAIGASRLGAHSWCKAEARPAVGRAIWRSPAERPATAAFVWLGSRGRLLLSRASSGA